MIKFKTFSPYKVSFAAYERGDRSHDAATSLNNWLKENPNIEIISWQATPARDHNELYITIQYKEN